MPIFCVSDLHLATVATATTSPWRAARRASTSSSDYVETEGGQLYVLGDLFDFWQANISRAVTAYRDLLTRLDKMQAVYVAGNHDCALSAFIGQPALMPGHPFFLREVRGFERTIGGGGSPSSTAMNPTPTAAT